MKNTVCLTTTMLACLIVPVAGNAATPDWRYLEGGYLAYNGDGDYDPDGLQINGKYAIDQNFYLNGEYGWAESHSNDFTTLTLGGGYRFRFNPETDIYAGANFERIDSDGYHDNGYSLVSGVRSFITPELEVNGELGYLDMSDGDMTFKAAAYYYLNPQLAIGASYELMDDADVFQLSGRYAF